MYKALINIKKIPNNIKIKIGKSKDQQLYLVGYKETFNKKKLPIIELSNNNRVWMLNEEIEFSIK
uniref:Cytochrome b6-f complex subunit PetP n=1 Tax=Cliftonaea pectinata TaxID=2007206 RepID=A0A1Z1MQY0_9FLOR|nr:cytochrome b6-f complex subunit PetP [Cliftonaea pectinata]ARW68161.1 cytochrome b6-f complex subunit PetP [Cliftonaea pectinata]